MSSVIRFIKKKLQPIKRQLTCSGNIAASSSISRSCSFDKSKSTFQRNNQFALSHRSKVIRKRSKSSVHLRKTAKKSNNSIESTFQKQTCSNATYTLQKNPVIKDKSLSNEHSHSSRIVDYLKNLELRRAMKQKSSNFCEKNKLKNNQDFNGKHDTCEGISNDNQDTNLEEMNRLQEEFFNDDHSIQLSQKNINLTTTKTTSSPLSLSSSFSSMSSRPDLNSSLEKNRRSVCSPKIRTNLNSTVCAQNGFSRLSLINDFEQETNEFNLSLNNLTETLEKVPSISETQMAPSRCLTPLLQSVSGSNLYLKDDCQRFVRGDPGTRLSIKRMIKSLIEHQTIALQKLEQFYEFQINCIETKRESELALALDEQKERINLLYNQKLRVLEQRVQINLQQLLEKKSGFPDNPSTDPSQNINRMYNQLILNQLNQFKIQQQQHPTKQKQTLKNPVRTLSNLKANMTTCNQNNIFPSRLHSINRNNGVDISVQKDTIEYQEYETGNLRRNFSLPFKQRRQKISEQIWPQCTLTKERQSQIPFNAYDSTIKAPAFVKNFIHKKPTIEGLKSLTNINLIENISISSPTAGQENYENSCEVNFQTTTNHKLPTQDTAIYTPNGFAGYSNIKRENLPRSACLVRTEPTIHESTYNGRLLSHLHMLHSIHYEQQPKTMMKCISPRLSDGHLQYKLRVSNYMKMNALEKTAGLVHSRSQNHILSLHETEV